MFNYFNHREELIKRNTEETREITKKYISLYKTNHALLDIGIGQAAVYLKGEVSEINQLILLKIEKGLYGYLNQLNIIKIKLNKKNLSNFSFTAFDEDNLINFLQTKKIIINPVKAQKTAENIIKIMHTIENIPKKAKKLLKNNQDLTPEILLYQYILIGFVLDILYLNEEKYFHRQYIAVENNPDLLLEVSIKLAKEYKLSELTLPKFLTIMEDIPNIKQFYSLVENQTASSIVPIEHTNGLMGIATIVHLIINNKLPIGIGINTLPVHAGYFLKQRLITLDHDFQHAWDILKKKIFSADIMQPLMEICKEICMNHTDANEKAIYEDYIVMFYILHENPRLSDASVLKLSVPHYLLTRKS